MWRIIFSDYALSNWAMNYILYNGNSEGQVFNYVKYRHHFFIIYRHLDKNY